MLPENCSVIRREVKNARLRVREDGTVQLFVPMAFTDEDVEKLLGKKAKWIASKRQFFEQKTKIQLRRNEILLFGNRYAYFYSSKYHNKYKDNNRWHGSISYREQRRFPRHCFCLTTNSTSAVRNGSGGIVPKRKTSPSIGASSKLPSSLLTTSSPTSCAIRSS